MSGPKPRIPDCHPDRKHRGNGLCGACYVKAYREKNPRPKKPRQTRMADCHPDRKHRAKGLCDSCYQMAWMKAHPEADTGNTWLRNRPELHKQMNRRYHLWHKHRTRVEQYVEAWHRQEGKCANPRCGAASPFELADHRKGLHVDHDHATGKFRALLCPGCNVALAQVNDNPERLLGLVEYLARYGEN